MNHRDHVQDHYGTQGDHRGRVRTCDVPNCLEPTEHAEQLPGTDKWVCPACMSRIKARVQSKRAERRERVRGGAEIREAFRNSERSTSPSHSTLG